MRAGRCGLPDWSTERHAAKDTTLEEAKPFEAINVFAEALAASGVLGFAVFLGYWCVLPGKGVKYVKQAKDTELGVLLKALLWALVIELLVLQISPTILRTYLWVHIGILGAVMSVVKNLKKTCAMPAAESPMTGPDA